MTISFEMFLFIVALVVMIMYLVDMVYLTTLANSKDIKQKEVTENTEFKRMVVPVIK